jgi:hypothetical protein
VSDTQAKVARTRSQVLQFGTGDFEFSDLDLHFRHLVDDFHCMKAECENLDK